LKTFRDLHTLLVAVTHRVFFLIGIVGGGVQLGPLGTAATNRPNVPPRVIMMMEKLVE
jgi:hypothetical protein